MSDAIQHKRKEADSAWLDYLAALQEADHNRALVKESRRFIHAQNGEATPNEYIALQIAKEAQTRMDEEEERLARRFDTVSAELGALLLGKNQS